MNLDCLSSLFVGESTRSLRRFWLLLLSLYGHKVLTLASTQTIMMLQIIHVSKRTKRCLEFIVVERVLPLLNNEKKNNESRSTTKIGDSDSSESPEKRASDLRAILYIKTQKTSYQITHEILKQAACL